MGKLDIDQKFFLFIFSIAIVLLLFLGESGVIISTGLMLILFLGTVCTYEKNDCGIIKSLCLFIKKFIKGKEKMKTNYEKTIDLKKEYEDLERLLKETKSKMLDVKQKAKEELSWILEKNTEE